MKTKFGQVFESVTEILVGQCQNNRYRDLSLGKSERLSWRPQFKQAKKGCYRDLTWDKLE